MHEHADGRVKNDENTTESGVHVAFWSNLTFNLDFNDLYLKITEPNRREEDVERLA